MPNTYMHHILILNSLDSISLHSLLLTVGSATGIRALVLNQEILGWCISPRGVLVS